MFNGKLSIFRLLSFGVPKIIVVRHVKPVKKVPLNMADLTSMKHAVSSLKINMDGSFLKKGKLSVHSEF